MGVDIYHLHRWRAMSRKNRRLVADEPVEVQDFKGIIDHYIGIYKIYLKWMKASKPEDVNM